VDCNNKCLRIYSKTNILPTVMDRYILQKDALVQTPCFNQFCLSERVINTVIKLKDTMCKIFVDKV